MYIFEVISFHLEKSQLIIQCVKTVTLTNFCFDLFCMQSQWFLADILWKFPGNGQGRHPLQVYENIHECFTFSQTKKTDFCNNVPLQILSLLKFCFIEIRAVMPVSLQKNFLQVRFLGICRTNDAAAELYLELFQTYITELFEKIINSFSLLTLKNLRLR